MNIKKKKNSIDKLSLQVKKNNNKKNLTGFRHILNVKMSCFSKVLCLTSMYKPMTVYIDGGSLSDITKKHL